ncbi:hypothetical protein CKAN_02508400 [Cinnamomum micranthum f. kanehirae]|uniref:Uncharacterized protein n=1 Tax=Cinnamomum micranthum f. kanehirae TaxID=337451 RepID=A0A3S3NID9_9MAGN|nr:hypothetical protein CKAN_02508400 [Cinnamomum micranthum f. kanehirae]
MLVGSDSYYTCYASPLVVKHRGSSRLQQLTHTDYFINITSKHPNPPPSFSLKKKKLAKSISLRIGNII